MNLFDDDRVKWIRQKVVLALDISIDSFDAHFIETLERARAAGVAREELLSFLSSKNSAGNSLFFSSNSWTEDVVGQYFNCWIIVFEDVSKLISFYFQLRSKKKLK
jgi:hypothetical protein